MRQAVQYYNCGVAGVIFDKNLKMCSIKTGNVIVMN